MKNQSLKLVLASVALISVSYAAEEVSAYTPSHTRSVSHAEFPDPATITKAEPSANTEPATTAKAEEKPKEEPKPAKQPHKGGYVLGQWTGSGRWGNCVRLQDGATK